MFDNTAAKADVPIVKNNRLSWCDGSLRNITLYFVILACAGDNACLIGLPVADFGITPERSLRGRSAHPQDVGGRQSLMKEAGVLGALSNDQGVLIHLLGDHIPWCLLTMREATNTKPLTLTYGVVHQALMLADWLIIHGDNRAGLRGNILF